MKKIMLAMTILVSAAAILPANAAPRDSVANAKMFTTSPGATIRVGDQCWKQTDAGRGYGFWTSCDNSYSFAPGSRGGNNESNSGGGEGGGGEGGGGGGGGGNR